MPGYFGVQADIGTFGKALGTGFPWAAVAGPRSILDRMQWSDKDGSALWTFNGHRLTMKVVAANLEYVSAEGTYAKLHTVGNALLPDCAKYFVGAR